MKKPTVVKCATIAKPTVKMPGNTAVVRKRVVARPAVRTTTRVVAKPVAKQPTTKPTTARVIRATTTVSQKASARKSGVKLGEIEDLNPKFVKTDVPKRPLNDGKEVSSVKDTATEAKSKKIGARLRLRSAKKSVSKSETVQNTPKKAEFSTNKQKSAYALPKTPFINQDKVAKRPLSRNVYKKQLDALEKASKESKEAGKTVTIISKPEKESHIGVVITIVLTIILGAVAGTVAFLLLPK